MEKAIACGAKKIVEVGVSGGLQSFLKPGEVVVVTEATRDEGASYHHFPPNVKVESSERLRKLLIEQLQRAGHCASSWRCMVCRWCTGKTWEISQV